MASYPWIVRRAAWNSRKPSLAVTRRLIGRQVAQVRRPDDGRRVADRLNADSARSPLVLLPCCSRCSGSGGSVGSRAPGAFTARTATAYDCPFVRPGTVSSRSPPASIQVPLSSTAYSYRRIGDPPSLVGASQRSVTCAERRARADLEALIETSPVGVVVFEARTGALVSLNREAARIVQDLCGPGQSAEQLLGVITCRRADGREIALDRLPLARALDRAETVRAEEVVLSVPDGRSVTTLINATPIRDPDGPDDALASVVVTLQDLAPLQEIERMRAEFLGMVSHELRAPLTSIKGSAATALRTARLVGPAEVAQFFRIIDEQADRMDSLIGDLLDAGRIDTGTLSVAPEPSDVAVLVD